MRRNIYFNDQNDKLLLDLAEKMKLPMGEVIAIALQKMESSPVEDELDKQWHIFKRNIIKIVKINLTIF